MTAILEVLFAKAGIPLDWQKMGVPRKPRAKFDYVDAGLGTFHVKWSTKHVVDFEKASLFWTDKAGKKHKHLDGTAPYKPLTAVRRSTRKEKVTVTLLELRLKKRMKPWPIVEERSEADWAAKNAAATKRARKNAKRLKDLH